MRHFWKSRLKEQKWGKAGVCQSNRAPKARIERAYIHVYKANSAATLILEIFVLGFYYSLCKPYDF
jgi:hypothetical protein